MGLVEEHQSALSVKAVCNAIGLPRATYYRARSPSTRIRPPRTAPERSLRAEERAAVLSVLHEPRFADRAPAEVYATLLDEGAYLCSERTMYRILAANAESRERRNQLRQRSHPVPELLATRPNELWSWDITKLLGPVKWTYFYLYVIMDVFSRYVVGWMVAHRELSSLAETLIETTCLRQGIVSNSLTLHADRGSSMTSKTVALLLSDLGVTRTHSRPYVSNDNPFSEAQFKTMKYQPGFPQRFATIQDARAHTGPYFDWYNTEHRHGGIALLTPHDVHYGAAAERLAQRARVRAAAHVRHPERFVHGPPAAQVLPTQVWINPPPAGPPNPDHATGIISAMTDAVPLSPRLTSELRKLAASTRSISEEIH
jgi:putative transposase